jgi:DNA-binding XRE family transcriptional regulator
MVDVETKCASEKVMKQTKPRSYSRYSTDAAALLGKLIKLGRKERRLTAQDLASRAGITRGTLRRIEKGDLKCELGLVFEVATIVGLKLFDADRTPLTVHISRTDDKLALLPKSTHRPQRGVEDDF